METNNRESLGPHFPRRRPSLARHHQEQTKGGGDLHGYLGWKIEDGRTLEGS